MNFFNYIYFHLNAGASETELRKSFESALVRAQTMLKDKQEKKRKQAAIDEARQALLKATACYTSLLNGTSVSNDTSELEKQFRKLEKLINAENEIQKKEKSSQSFFTNKDLQILHDFLENL